MSFESTKIIELGSCAFRQPRADSHCKYIHGYRLTAKFWFSSTQLDENNWVVDFGGLSGLKQILKEQFDHTLCVSRTDPYLNEFKRLRDCGVCDLRVMDGVGIEKFAEWCFKAANKFVSGMTDNRCTCARVEVFEHENNSAIYEYVEPSEETKSVNQMKRSRTAEVAEREAEDIASTVDNKQQAADNNITRPPFSNKTGQPLRSRRSTGSWTDKEGSFGI